jgi:anti-sigma regulatory factor (Ser/Thr protein kinase)
MLAHADLNDLYRNRNRSVARSFYRQLRTEGFTHQQIIELSTALLDFVTDDLKEQNEQPSK